MREEKEERNKEEERRMEEEEKGRFLEEILALGQFWETIPTLEAISASEAVRSGELPVYQVCFS